MSSAKPRVRTILSLIVAISFLSVTSDAGTFQGQSIGVRWVSGSLDSALSQAKKQNKKVMAFVFATWCEYCSVMEKDVLSLPEISDYINASYIPVRLENSSVEAAGVREKYYVSSYPTFLFLKGDGSEFDRIVGQVEKETFLSTIKKIYNNISALDEYREQLKSKPKDGQLLYKMFSAYVERADVQNVETQLKLIKEADPAFFRSHKEGLLSSYSDVCYTTKNYEKAIALTNEIISYVLDQRVKSRYTFMANCYSRMEQNQKAMEVYYKVLDIAPQDIHSYTSIVNHAYLTNAGIDKAIETGNSGLSLQADSASKAEFLFCMARLYQKKQLTKKALDLMDKAIALNPVAAYQNFRDQLAGGSSTELKSPLVLSQEQWSFGAVQRGDKAEITISLENKSSTPVQLRVIKTCDCLDADPDELKLDTGLRATIKLIYHATDNKGKVEKFFVFETNVKGKERILFSLSGEVK